MIITHISRQEVLEKAKLLPAFPAVIQRILETIDDVDANLNVLIDYVGQDPIIASRVISMANAVALRTKNLRAIGDIHTAISLIGISPVRSIAIAGSFDSFCGEANSKIHSTFIKHSVSVGVCCEEIAHFIETPISPEHALMAGLLHDLGHLWLQCFRAEDFAEVWRRAQQPPVCIEGPEREAFGVDHSTIGAWMAEQWLLPKSIYTAIQHHHAPDTALNEPLVAITHVAEVLCNALELGGGSEAHVTKISAGACDKLGLKWNTESRQLFGRVEARCRYTNSLFAL
ncbi:MAG: HDOD domain-containing protein [Gallionellaceae bacterium]